MQRWLNEKRKNKVNYYYYSMDHDTEVIFEFHNVNVDMWKVYSSWHTADLDILVNDHVLSEEIKKLINDINTDINNRFGISINDFL
ncbi:hypothetical protein XI25_12700 [Paenibacillus sp. DMB20]|nr:hypothetical protein XI25_12700 [Paenibacillus sp. DMB20]